MSGRILADTNLVIALFAADHDAQDAFSSADEVFMSSVVLGELYYGARNSSQILSNTSRLDTFALSNVIIPCDADTSRQYGITKASLRAKSRMIPENDIWIEVTAIQHELILVTRDAHFNEIDGLVIELW